MKADTFKKTIRTLKGQEKKTLTFDDFFKDYGDYTKHDSEANELNKIIIADAKKVYEQLKTPEAISNFYKQKDSKKVPGLDKDHSGASFYAVCKAAREYAVYVATQSQMMTYKGKDDR